MLMPPLPAGRANPRGASATSSACRMLSTTASRIVPGMGTVVFHGRHDQLRHPELFAAAEPTRGGE